MFGDSQTHPAGIPLDMSISVRRLFGKCERSPPLRDRTIHFDLSVFLREENLMPINYNNLYEEQLREMSDILELINYRPRTVES